MSFNRIKTFQPGGGVNVVVESPRGSKVKFKFDPKLDVFTVSRPLVDGLVYPHDWGFVPSTRGPDGDPIDAMILWDRASFPGIVVACRLIGLAGVEQNRKKTPGTRERNDRVIAVPLNAPQFDTLRDIEDLSARKLKELESFFVAATTFENKEVELLGWSGAEQAYALVKASARTKAGRHHPSSVASRARST
jgi:inorganic pyrophosphatase